MNAVNLIPRDLSSGGHRPATGVGPYIVLGALALVVAMSGLYTLTTRGLAPKRAEVARITAQATAAEATAAKLKRYSTFSTLRKTRVENVKNLANSRFDWASSLHEVARILPAGTWITSLRASVSPTSSVDGNSDQLRTALPVPALELVGCAPNQATVAETTASLRRVSGAQRVTLSSSKKAPASGSKESTASTDGCGTKPQFSVTVFYKAQSSAASTTAATTASAATPASGATGAGSTSAAGTTGTTTP
jgi:Tfp pilus assembly protein PilN